MMIRFLSVLVGIACLVSGCATPIGAKGATSKSKRSGNRVTSAGQKRSISHISSTGGKSSPEGQLRVGTETLHAADLWREIEGEFQAQTTLPEAELRRLLDQRAAQLVTDKLSESLLYQKASARLTEQSTKAVERFVDAEIRKIVTEDFGGVQRRYEKHLETRGTTLDDMREKIRREIVIASYLETELRPKIAEPTRAELISVYEADQSSSDKKERRRMSLITIRIPDFVPKDVAEPTREHWTAAREEARVRAGAIQKELEAGKSFDVVAREYSSDLHAVDGGDWGWVSLGSVRERFEPAVAALFRLAIGVVSEPVETPDDIFIVKCVGIDAGREMSFEAAQSEIKERYSRRAFARLVSDRVVELRQRTPIETTDLERFHKAVVDAGIQHLSVASDGPVPASND